MTSRIVAYINIPCIPTTTNNYINVIDIIAKKMETTGINNILYQINYVLLGNANDKNLAYSFIQNQNIHWNLLNATTDDITDKKTIMTELYNFMAAKRECYYEILFIDLYDIIHIENALLSIQQLQLISTESLPPQLSTPPTTQLYSNLLNLTYNEYQLNWINYLCYFYFMNASYCIGNLYESNVIGIDIKNAYYPYYVGNWWWSNSVYVQTLVYNNGICTPYITNGIYGGLYISIWNSTIEWDKCIIDTSNYHNVYNNENNGNKFNIHIISKGNGFLKAVPICRKERKPTTVKTSYPQMFSLNKANPLNGDMTKPATQKTKESPCNRRRRLLDWGKKK